jgi:hypothetical protein
MTRRDRLGKLVLVLVLKEYNLYGIQLHHVVTQRQAVPNIIMKRWVPCMVQQFFGSLTIICSVVLGTH